MNGFVVVLVTAGFIALNLRQAEGECDVADYTSLKMANMQCSANQRTIDNLNQEQRSASGDNVLSVFKKYCKYRHLIHMCVKDYLNRKMCTSQQKAYYDKLILVSDGFCDKKRVKSDITNIYKGTPSVGTVHSGDKCIEDIVKRKGKCMLTVSSKVGVTDEHGEQSKLVSSMKCAIEGFETLTDVCQTSPRQDILITTLVNAQMVVPPPLGADVSHALKELSEHRKEHP